MKKDIIKWIQDWFAENGDENTKAVIGISGGVDSSVVAALCVEALGKERVFGVLMPNGNQHDIQDAIAVVDSLGIYDFVVNIQDIYEKESSVLKSVYKTFGGSEANYKLALGNTEARIRMTVLYGISQVLGGRVSNNCNKSEQFIGYATRWGDDVGDFAPLRDLTKAEVVKLGLELMTLPEHLITKTPIDGLENNKNEDGTFKTDEDAMGFTYEQLDARILLGTSGSLEIDGLIERKHKASAFKRRPIAQYTKGD